MKSITVAGERVRPEDEPIAPSSQCVLEASVVAVRGSVVHRQVHDVHVVVMRVDGRVVVVVEVVVVVVVIVQGGQVLQGGHVGGRGQPGHDHLVVHPALGRDWWVAGAGRHEQGSLYRLWVRGGHGVRVRWVFLRRAHARSLGVGDGLWRRADPLP